MGWTVAVLVIYVAGMILVGVRYFKKSDSLSDYFIGGRRLTSWVAALSVFASDMSGWLLMGFAGAVYAHGTGETWIALGLVLGSVLNWILVAKRLRRYSLTAQYSITIPEFFENRFRDSSHTLRLVSSFFIILFFTVYTAAGFVACGTLFSQIFGIDYHIALLAGTLVILAYTSLGGFRAVCWTDFFQGLIMLAAIIAVPVIAVCLMGGFPKILAELPPGFLDPLRDRSGGPLPAVSVISGLTWGLGYFGMPHILIRFMAVENEKAVYRAACIAGVAIVVSLAGAVIMGAAGRAIRPGISDPSRIFIVVIQKIFTDPGALFPAPVLGGLFFCGIFAAIMSTADSQLILSASALTSDLYRGLVHKEGGDKYFLRLSRISVAAVSIIAYLIARDQSSALFTLVSSAWSGFGSAFGALMLLSLYWKRLTRAGAVAGICAGGLTVILWDYVSLIPRDGRWLNLGEATGLYSLTPGFCLSFFCIVAVSLITKPPSAEILEEFEIAAAKPFLEE
ncbi:MAG: sodium/proline symporter [Treponema sp.]|jgi:sodium/proline symporter|nr:sodium/proline symporter [Treponema sp.]